MGVCLSSFSVIKNSCSILIQRDTTMVLKQKRQHPSGKYRPLNPGDSDICSLLGLWNFASLSTIFSECFPFFDTREQCAGSIFTTTKKSSLKTNSCWTLKLKSSSAMACISCIIGRSTTPWEEVMYKKNKLALNLCIHVSLSLCLYTNFTNNFFILPVRQKLPISWSLKGGSRHPHHMFALDAYTYQWFLFFNTFSVITYIRVTKMYSYSLLHLFLWTSIPTYHVLNYALLKHAS